MRLLILLTLLLPMTAQAVDLSHVFKQEKWDWDDYAMTTASTLALVVDWRQTRWMSKNWDKGHSEKNKILGKYPSTEHVDYYFGTLGLLHLGSALFLSKKYRLFENGYVVFMHGKAALHNYRANVEIEF